MLSSTAEATDQPLARLNSFCLTVPAVELKNAAFDLKAAESPM